MQMLPDALGWLLYAWVLAISPEGEYSSKQLPVQEFVTRSECQMRGRLIMAEEQGLIYQCKLKDYVK